MTCSLTRDNEEAALFAFRFSFQMHPSIRLRHFSPEEWVMAPSRTTVLVDLALCVERHWRKRYSPTPPFVHFPPAQLCTCHLWELHIFVHSINDQMACPFPLRLCILPCLCIFPDSVLHIFRVLVGKLVLHFGTSHSKERRIFPTLLQPLFILLLLQLVLPGKRQKDGHQEIHMKAMNIPYPGSSYLPYSANYFEGSLCFHCFCE